jgi:transketolase
MAVLLASHLCYDLKQPRALGNDQLIFSKGHAAPLLYAVLKAAGAISDAQLMTLRKRGSVIEGHPTPRLPYVEVATGSLGQGLAVAVGMALAAKRLDRAEGRFWVLLGDSEMAEGSIYESFELGGFYGLSNLIAILDMNRLGQRGPTMLGWEGEHYAARARAFGWESAVIDGNDPAAIDAAYSAAERSARPTLVVARTKKGAGVSFLADQEGWHGKALSRDEAKRALAELGWSEGAALVVKPKRPNTCEVVSPAPVAATELPHYSLGAQVATRAAFGDALAALGSSNPRVVVLDGEVSNSTYTDKFAKAHPEPLLRDLYRRAAVGIGRRRPTNARLAAIRGDLCGIPHPSFRPDPHGGDLGSHLEPRRLTRRRIDWRGRALTDGTGGSGDAARSARQRSALSVLRERDHEAGGGDGGPRRYPVPTHHTRENDGALSTNRGFSHRRLQSSAPLRQ